MARIDFAGEAYETEAKILRSLKGYTVEVVAPTKVLPAGERFDAELVDVVAGDWTDGTIVQLRRFDPETLKYGEPFEARIYELTVY